MNVFQQHRDTISIQRTEVSVPTDRGKGKDESEDMKRSIHIRTRIQKRREEERGNSRILEHPDDHRFRGFLQCQECTRLKSQGWTVRILKAFRDLTHNPREGQFPEQESMTPLVLTDLLQCFFSRTVMTALTSLRSCGGIEDEDESIGK